MGKKENKKLRKLMEPKILTKWSLDIGLSTVKPAQVETKKELEKISVSDIFGSQKQTPHQEEPPKKLAEISCQTEKVEIRPKDYISKLKYKNKYLSSTQIVYTPKIEKEKAKILKNP